MFQHEDYKELIQEQVKSLNKVGVWRQLSEALQVQSVVVSQIFKGARELNDEQAFLTAEFFGFNEQQREFFLLLVQYNKCSHHKLKSYLKTKLEKIRASARRPSGRVSTSDKQHEHIYPLYYSDWRYALLRIMTFVSGKEKDIIENVLQFQLTPPQTSKMLQDLVKWGILKLEGKTYVSSSQRIHLPDDSPLLQQHLQNWRLASLKKIHSGDRTEDPILYTTLVSVDKSTADKIKETVTNMIQAVSKSVIQSPSEQVYNLNIDFYRLF